MSQNSTILIVEDNEMSLKMAKSLLQLAGYNTLEAENADQGIELARQHLPNLILLDMNLPMKSGYEASRELKADPKTGSIPIVAFTALAMQEEQERALANGCVGVISKPIDIKQFPKMIENFLAVSEPHSVEPGVMDLNVCELLENPACDLPDGDKLKQDFEEFLFHVSHDLQGPLRKILQFSRFLEVSEDTVQDETEKQAYYQGIYRSAKEMESMLHGLLTLSRIHCKGTPFVDLSLNDVVSCALSRYRYEIQDSNARVDVGELPCVHADPIQMRMVFEELLGNALKFKKEGRPPVIRIHSAERANGFEISVEDNGIGFPESAAERVFKPFQRLNGASRFPGHGLGLAIVKRIIERHGGEVQALPDSGNGTTIRIQLPARPR